MEGEFEIRVAVQARQEHVVAVVEDFLRAIAVVVIDVEDRDAGVAVVDEALGGDGGIVEVAIAAEEIAARMMARRAAEREGRAFA